MNIHWKKATIDSHTICVIFSLLTHEALDLLVRSFCVFFYFRSLTINSSVVLLVPLDWFLRECLLNYLVVALTIEANLPWLERYLLFSSPSQGTGPFFNTHNSVRWWTWTRTYGYRSVNFRTRVRCSTDFANPAATMTYDLWFFSKN
jgi:hypothetical protein